MAGKQNKLVYFKTCVTLENMLNRKARLLVLLCILLCLPLASCTNCGHKSELASDFAAAQLKPIITKNILANGLTVLITEEHTHPVVTVMTTVGAGLSSEAEYAGSGISHFVEHMAFKRTAKRAPGEIEEEVKSYGGVINASTGLDSTNYHITVPKEYVRQSLGLLEDITFHPDYDAEEFGKERGVILKEIKMNLDDPSRRVMRELWKTSFVSHPYKKPIIGYENRFKELTLEDLRAYHLLKYAPENTILTITGDVETNDILGFVKSIYGKSEQIERHSLTPTAEKKQDAERVVDDFAHINLTYLAMGYHTVSLLSEDLYALDVLSIILGSGDGSRLNKKIVKKSELLYSISAYNYTPKYPGLFIIYGIGNFDKMNTAKKEILNEIDKISREGPDPEELEGARNMVISSYIDSLETTSGLAGGISQGEFLANDPDFFKEYVSNVKKVTEKEIKKVAKKYLIKNNLTVSTLYPDYISEMSRLPQSGTGLTPPGTVCVLSPSNKT